MFTLHLLPPTYAICRREVEYPIPFEIPPGEDLISLTVTSDEISLVCREGLAPQGVPTSRGWRALKVAGPLDFTLTGVLASLTAPLAEASVSVFTISTYETDILLVPSTQLGNAIEALRARGHHVLR